MVMGIISIWFTPIKKVWEFSHLNLRAFLPLQIEYVADKLSPLCKEAKSFAFSKMVVLFVYGIYEVMLGI